MNAQFITDDYGNKISIVIPIHEYDQMMEELEEFHDIKLYDEAKSHKEEAMPLADYLKTRKKQVNHG